MASPCYALLYHLVIAPVIPLLYPVIPPCYPTCYPTGGITTMYRTLLLSHPLVIPGYPLFCSVVVACVVECCGLCPRRPAMGTQSVDVQCRLRWTSLVTPPVRYPASARHVVAWDAVRSLAGLTALDLIGDPSRGSIPRRPAMSLLAIQTMELQCSIWWDCSRQC